MARLRAVPEVLARSGELVVERDPRRPTGRLLRQADMDASYVDLADATHLEFSYMRWMRATLELAGARRVVHVGGAACALPRALAAKDPEQRHEVCELDAEVLELARAHLGLRKQPGLKVRHGDGRAHLASRPDASADAVVIDAFTGARVPPHLVTVEALADAARVAPLLLVNVVDGRRREDVRAIAAALREVLPHVVGLGARGLRTGNTVLVASQAKLPTSRMAARIAADPQPAVLTSADELAQLTAGTPPGRD